MSSASVSAVRLRSRRLAVRGGLVARVCDESLLVLALLLFASFAVAVMPYMLGPDSWLSLLGGREISRSGIPHTDPFAVMSQGRPWINEQWLAPFGLYRIEQVVGVAAVLVLVWALQVAPVVFASV